MVSIRKFVVLEVATVGLYGTYWFFKQWACYRDSHPGTRVWPLARAILSVFFVHALFRHVKSAGAGNPVMTPGATIWRPPGWRW